MDVVERLTLEAAAAETMLACEHRHRYEFAARFCAGQRVLDLCCGSGYGTAILATRAREVLGVDNDAGTVDLAAASLADRVPNAAFTAADAVSFLRSQPTGSFDVIVCFEGLEHLPDLPGALAGLREHALGGTRIVASLPNGKVFREDNPFHVTEFGYDEAHTAFAGFPGVVMLPQFLAEGSLICPAEAAGVEVEVSLEDRHEPEYANHFIFCVGIDPERLAAAHHGRVQLNTSPVFNRWAEDLNLASARLWRENARLARARLGQGGSAAAAKLANLTERERGVAALQKRALAAEARVAELERLLAGLDGEPSAAPGAPGAAGSPGAPETSGAPLEVPQPALPRAVLAEGEHPNSWEARLRRAAGSLIPWIEQTVPLAGRTVLEYGCGNGAVACALAARCERVIGVDIDRAGVEEGRERLTAAGVANVELELYELDSIEAAVRARSGQIDVFVLYAVLEHMTVAERLAVLRLAREVTAAGGAIVVCETPNRLFPFDHHTARVPFFHLLPAELALDYRGFSDREDFNGALDLAAVGGREALLEALTRWGRSVSYHEFELVFEELSRHVIASSYDPLLFAERPVHREELSVERYLRSVRPDLAPAWSRAWLDLILSPAPQTRRPPFLRPWTPDTSASRGVAWTRWENLRLTAADSVLRIELPHPTSRLVLGTATGSAPARLRVRAAGSDELLAATAEAVDGWAAYLDFPLPVPAVTIDVGADVPRDITFVGYEE